MDGSGLAANRSVSRSKMMQNMMLTISMKIGAMATASPFLWSQMLPTIGWFWSKRNQAMSLPGMRQYKCPVPLASWIGAKASLEKSKRLKILSELI